MTPEPPEPEDINPIETHELPLEQEAPAQEYNEPTHEQIAAVARLYYQARIEHDEPGDALSDWLAAEDELRYTAEDGGPGL